MYHIAIVEDEPAAMEQILALVHRFVSENCLEASVHSFSSGESLLTGYPAHLDLILMDIQMEGMDGLQTAKALRLRDPQVLLIFVTNMTQYAIDGYRVDAMDYIVKPVAYGLLANSLSRAFARLRERQPQFIVVKTTGGECRIAVNALYCVEAVNHRTLLHVQGQPIPCNETLNNIEQKLKDFPFYRCHAAFLVRLPSVERTEGSDVLVAGIRVPVSKHRKKAFLDHLAAFWGTQL